MIQVKVIYMKVYVTIGISSGTKIACIRTHNFCTCMVFPNILFTIKALTDASCALEDY